jgi:TonB family protein
LREKRANATMLNAREFKYYGYMQIIRRQVNFYWSQSLDNIGPLKEKLNRSSFTTILNVTLDKKGNLKQLSMVRSCGVKPFDEATLAAFRLAAPFPPPPEGMLNEVGDAEMPEFGFTVTLTPGPAPYSGIDPRANVLFPGIYRSQ